MEIMIYIFFLHSYIYENSDSLLISNDSFTICGNHQYNLKIHLENNALLKVRDWNEVDSTGKIILVAPLIHIHHSMIDGSKKGYSGGNNTHPNGYGPGCGYAGIGGGGGGGAYGGAGGDGGDLNPGAGGTPYGNADDTLINMGSGGGVGRLSTVDGFGGSGGGLVYLRAKKIIMDTAMVLTNGSNGFDGSYEAGGGGSGGGIKLWADTMILRCSSIVANGGSGGNAEGGGGGGGGGGRIKIFYTIIDTIHLELLVNGGDGGYGGYGNGENGSTGTIYFGPLIGIKEESKEEFYKPLQKSIITRGRMCVNQKNIEFSIYDSSGSLIGVINTDGMLDLLRLKNGVYFLRKEKDQNFIKIILIR